MGVWRDAPWRDIERFRHRYRLTGTIYKTLRRRLVDVHSLSVNGRRRRWAIFIRLVMERRMHILWVRMQLIAV
jgi:hypothetical protein